MAETAFSENGKYYAALSQDGRLRIWDTETNVLKQEYTPDLHLTSPPSCIQWIKVTLSAPSQRKSGRKKNSFSEEETQYIALGTGSGKILIYSVVQAKVETVLTDDKNAQIQSRRVTCLDWHKKYGLYSCSKEVMYEWDVQNACVRNKYNINVENKKSNSVSAVKIVPHSQNTPAQFIVTSSNQLRIWRLHSGTAVVMKCLGHSGAQRALLTLTSVNDMTYLIQGSQNERLLSFWDVTITSDHIPQVNGEDVSPIKKQRKKSTSEPAVVNTPMYNFVLEDAPRSIDVNALNEGSAIVLTAATRSGVIHYYSHVLNGSSSKPIKPSVTIQVTTADAQPLALQCCRYDADMLLVGYTAGVKLIFERVTPDLKSKTQVLIRGDSKPSKKKGNKKTNKLAAVDDEKVTYVEPLGGVSRKRATPGGKIEVPMEARLANLSLDLKSRSQSAVNQNLTKLLMQGLHSKDKSLFLMVVQQNDPAVAARTVSCLPADYIPLLLQQLADMATRKTSQCALVCTWVSAVVRRHAALLLASAHTADTLTQILAVFTQRRSHLCQLLNLKGRLELTSTQRSGHDDITENHEPILDYNDDTSEESDMEIERPSSASSQEWDARDSDKDGRDSDKDERDSRVSKDERDSASDIDDSGSDSDG